MIKQFYLTLKWNLNRYYSRERVNQGIMALKGYSTFPKLKDWNFTLRWIKTISWTLVGEYYPPAEMQSPYSMAFADCVSLGGSYPSAEIQSVYSAAPIFWVEIIFRLIYIDLTYHLCFSRLMFFSPILFLFR